MKFVEVDLAGLDSCGWCESKELVGEMLFYPVFFVAWSVVF